MNINDISVVVVGDLVVGNKAEVTALGGQPGHTISFLSSNSEIAKVLPYDKPFCPCNSKCYLYCVAEGSFTLDVIYGGCKKIYSFTVQPEDDGDDSGGGDDDPGHSIALNVDSLVLKVGEHYAVKAITKPEGSVVTWSSSNSEIAAVVNGIVTGLSKGDATITACMDELRAKCHVKVCEIGIDEEEYRIGIGQKFKVPVDVYPCQFPICWASDNPAVATVDCHGAITGISLGDARITASVHTSTGTITSTVTIHVVEAFTPVNDLADYDINAIELYCTEAELRLANTKVTIKVMPEGEKVPQLFYVRIDDNPYIFNYKLCAIREDVEKYLLRNSAKEG
jgi:hypothetical protein